MMQCIKNIEIRHFKGLYGNFKIDLSRNGNNLMLYGENGSGKSSVAKAIKLFFLSADEEVDISKYENIFIKEAEQNSGYIKLTFGEKGNRRSAQIYELSNDNNIQTENFIVKANKIKGFLDYKSLLKTHFIDTEEVNIFELLVNNLLADFIASRSQNSIKDDWNWLLRVVRDKRIKEYKNELISQNGRLEKFNADLKELLEEVEIKANEIIEYFNYNLKIHFHFNNVVLARKKGFVTPKILLKIDFFDKQNLQEHHNFLNEARLTAISIAIYLGAVLTNPETDYKLLVLDDIFIGLDTSNRLPFLKVLDDKFSDYQIFMTTYDKSWYELVKSEKNRGWTFAELYVKEEHQNGYEIPILKAETDYIQIAKDYLNNGDLKASATYIRSEFERLISKFCNDKRIAVKFNKNPGKVSSEDFWSAMKNKTYRDNNGQEQRYITEQLRDGIEIQRTLVMNPFVHYDIEKPEFRAELQRTIDLVELLKNELNANA